MEKSKLKDGSKEYIIKEECNICKNDLKPITNEEGFIIDFYCEKCGISWNLEDLPIIEIKIQITMDKFI